MTKPISHFRNSIVGWFSRPSPSYPRSIFLQKCFRLPSQHIGITRCCCSFRQDQSLLACTSLKLTKNQTNVSRIPDMTWSQNRPVRNASTTNDVEGDKSSQETVESNVTGSSSTTTAAAEGIPKKIKKVTTLSIASKKRRGHKITMVTAYDYPSAVHVDRAGIDVVLVGDSCAMVELGFETTQVGCCCMITLHFDSIISDC